MEERRDAQSDAVRLRYLAPALASPLTRPSFEALTQDLEHLCGAFGLAAHDAWGRTDAQIVISLSAEPVEFGVLRADVPQVFEAFRVENGSCMLEIF